MIFLVFIGENGSEHHFFVNFANTTFFDLLDFWGFGVQIIGLVGIIPASTPNKGFFAYSGREIFWLLATGNGTFEVCSSWGRVG